MTAHCRPYTYDDFDLAADKAISILAREGFGTAQQRKVAAVLRELFDPPPCPTIAAALPVGAESTPSSPSLAGRD